MFDDSEKDILLLADDIKMLELVIQWTAIEHIPTESASKNNLYYRSKLCFFHCIIRFVIFQENELLSQMTTYMDSN